MASALKSRLRLTALRRNLYQNLAFAFCILFGLAMIADIQLSGDGLWFWYATLLRGGHRLYADMHLALQPLFVLENAWFMALFGKGWLVSKIPAVLHLLAYTFGLLLLLRYATLRDSRKAILLGSAFFVSILSIAYRFDDYHVLTESFQIYALILLLVLQKAATLRRTLLIAAVLGLLSGLAFVTRVNDGAALLLGVVLALLALAPTHRFLSILLCILAAGLSVLGIVALTGDTFHDYAVNSIFQAAGSKGGAGSVLAYPFLLPRHTLRWLRYPLYPHLLLYTFAVAAIWVFILRTLRHPTTRGLLLALTGFLLILLPLHRHNLYAHLITSEYIVGISILTPFVLYGLGLLVFLRYLRWQFTPAHAAPWNPREMLLILPLGQLASLSMSTGGNHIGIYAPTAALILLLPISSPLRLKSGFAGSFLLTIAGILFCYGVFYKTREPYRWHSYAAKTLFVGRQWYRHPVYGPMILESDMLQFIQPVCAQVGMNQPGTQLLSLPYPFANYFCAIPPWHGYVQTYYDTSTREVMDRLMTELQQAPPEWILYQRQPESLQIHERVFNHGRPLPHRFLDQFLQQKIDQGAWRTTQTSTYGSAGEWNNQWLLIHTHP